MTRSASEARELERFDQADVRQRDMVVEIVPEATGQIAHVRHEDEYPAVRSQDATALVQGRQQCILVGDVFEEVRREDDVDLPVRDGSEIGREDRHDLDVGVSLLRGDRIRINRDLALGVHRVDELAPTRTEV